MGYHLHEGGVMKTLTWGDLEKRCEVCGEEIDK